jgi:hypothetical protein
MRALLIARPKKPALHLWESGESNVLEITSQRRFEFPTFDAYLADFANSAFQGPLLWHYWSTPAGDCDDCTDEAFCDECAGEGAPADFNTLWLLISTQAGYVWSPYIVTVDVLRSDEARVRRWLICRYAERGLLREFLKQ